jgi:very-short-patch-repair endonuclease
MKNLNKSYSKLSSQEKSKLINDLYTTKNHSFADIASLYDTYANRIRRDAIKFNIPIRNKSEAQKNALGSGKHKHPTKGKKRDQQTKDKIGMGVLKAWDKLDNVELQKRKEKIRDNWEQMSEDKKASIIKLANNSVRHTSKVGSKLEKFLLSELLAHGFDVEFHKEQSLINTKLQIDLFLPKINIAIEVDGPSHFLPIWGEDALKKTQTYDSKKQGLILGKGLVLIRIKQTKDFSKSRSRLIFDNLMKHINIISLKFPPVDQRNLEIKD